MRNGKLMTKRVAAIALSSMMVLSPLTAFAADPTVNNPTDVQNLKDRIYENAANKATQGDVYGLYYVDQDGNYVDENGNPSNEKVYVKGENGNIQVGEIEVKIDEEGNTEKWNTYFLDDGGSSTKRDDNGSVIQAAFKKTINMKNIKNEEFIPSVPDIKYTYQIYISNDDIDKDIASYNGSLLKPGVPGGIKGVTKEAPFETYVVFHHDDKADGDVSANDYKGRQDGNKSSMTKLVTFEMDPEAFKGQDPGVYRYIAFEVNEENTNEQKADGSTDILDDVTKIADKYRARILDVVIERATDVPTDDRRLISGVAMHEVELATFEKTSGKIKWSIVSDSVKEVKADGYTDYSFNTQDSYKNGPEEAHSRYYTYDFVIGKELTGRGIVEADKSKPFKFNITIKAPQGADIASIVATRSVTGFTADDLSKKPAEDMQWTIGTDGTKAINGLTLMGTDHFEISGLPSGAIVTVTEVEYEDSFDPHHNEAVVPGLEQDGALIAYKSETGADGKITYKYDREKFTQTVVDNAKAKGDTHDYTILNYVATDSADVTKGEIEVSEALSKDIQNAFIVNVKNPITVTGVVMNVAPYALMVIAAAIFAGLFISKKRQEEEL